MNFPKIGQWCVMDGFNLHEGPQRWQYTKVLSILDTRKEAEAATPEPLDVPTDGGPYLIDLGEDTSVAVGPVTAKDWFHEFDGQLWVVILDPDGYPPERTRFPIPGRQPTA